MSKFRVNSKFGEVLSRLTSQRSSIYKKFLQSARLRLIPVLTIGFIGLSLLNQTALAEVKQIHSTVRPSKDQTFAELMERAEFVAEQLVNQAFTRNPKITEVSVTVLGERNGQEAPLLLSSVSRENWKKNPNIQRWTIYFNNFSIALLGYRKPLPATPQTSPPTPAPTLTPTSPQLPASGSTSSGSNPGIPQDQTNPGSNLPQPGVGTQNAQPSPTTPLTPSTVPNATSPNIAPTSISSSPTIFPSRARIKDDPAYRDD